MRQRFHIDLKEGNAKAVLKKENKQFVDELPKAEAKLQHLKAKVPFIYELMRKTYGLIKH